MKNILITGSGVHMKLYVETLMFSNVYNIQVVPDNENKRVEDIKKYGINVHSKDKIKKLIAETDLVIVANTTNKKMEILEILNEHRYMGPIILEKPIALSKELLDKKMQLIETNRYLAAYSRLFYEESILQLVSKDEKKVALEWPNLSCFGINLLQDTLPHVLDMVLIIYKNRLPSITAFDYNKGVSLSLCFLLDELEVKVNVYESENDTQKVMFDNHIMEWPNTHNFIPKMIDTMLANNTDIIRLNNSMDEKISYLLFDILECCNKI